ncbi:hypothetical protein PUNSTDRAFT_63724 [Punctularia strigosozonata HHB-11173 SS5]|uniref:uncharacterized protein n=1 Tax=Punctularia strigosozonata (strain HHB-11173) TaxID=741275 RepID=UPI0004417A11|nr:uncharacterized protein PUNSTDRAFT_63724 [Punctularia strigosozonata HHB-11173 SS5]EIN10218.1 hypothetical protein PUNSTDRAFT_63724 [Punctularia strigosozonata HHB-11173 SS5]
MKTWLLLSLVLPAYALEKTHGVHPALIPRYVPTESATWRCLDGSKEIAWSAVNDDYCDCPDGSDEPGTGACPGTTFYCVNEGHIGANISSTRVNDGLCEKECCDGSDERPGLCPNICKQIGEEFRKQRDAELKTRKTGAKIRSTYVAFAQKEKKRLEEEIARSDLEIAAREKEVARLRDVLERTESLSAAALEEKKKSPLYTSLITHHNALKSLQRVHKQHLEREKALGDILDALRTGYNPNYQDMAVLEAVRGWEFLAGLPHINDVGKDVSEEGSDEVKDVGESETKEEDLEPGMWTEGQLTSQLDELLDTDHVSLLIEHERHSGAPDTGVVFDISSYLPESLLPQYEAFRETLASWLTTFGLVKPSGDTSAGRSAEKARSALHDAEHSLKLTRDEKKEAEENLEDLFDIKGFGAQGEWKKLESLCLEKDTGEYTYEVCLFDEARQKPNKGGQTFSLGKFKSWHPSSAVTPGTPEYYSKQVYDQGARCWNGPMRSVKLSLSCGTDNVLLTVAEAEKCEYEFTATTPALCLPVEASEMKKDEL